MLGIRSLLGQKRLGIFTKALDCLSVDICGGEIEGSERWKAWPWDKF